MWHPNTGDFTPFPNNLGHNIGCAGHAALGDGSILVAGGGGEHAGAGNWQTSIFAVTGKGGWQGAAFMNNARWYPTCTTLPDGRVLAISGNDELGFRVVIPEIYNPNADPPTWNEMPSGVAKLLPNYPFMFVEPQGNKVFFAGPGVGTYTLDIDTASWVFRSASHFGGGGGSAVMYEPGKVLKSGGTGGDRTDVIDLNVQTPAWTEVDEMEEARRQHTLVLLPTGDILALGGEQDADPDPDIEDWQPVLDAEWFNPNDPVQPLWKRLAQSL